MKINSFYNKAKLLKKENLSDIHKLSTFDGSICVGFTYIENGNMIKIYYHEDSACFCIEEVGEEPHEIGLYELN